MTKFFNVVPVVAVSHHLGAEDAPPSHQVFEAILAFDAAPNVGELVQTTHVEPDLSRRRRGELAGHLVGTWRNSSRVQRGERASLQSTLNGAAA